MKQETPTILKQKAPGGKRSRKSIKALHSTSKPIGAQNEFTGKKASIAAEQARTDQKVPHTAEQEDPNSPLRPFNKKLKRPPSGENKASLNASPAMKYSKQESVQSSKLKKFAEDSLERSGKQLLASVNSQHIKQAFLQQQEKELMSPEKRLENSRDIRIGQPHKQQKQLKAIDEYSQDLFEEQQHTNRPGSQMPMAQQDQAVSFTSSNHSKIEHIKNAQQLASQMKSQSFKTQKEVKQQIKMQQTRQMLKATTVSNGGLNEVQGEESYLPQARQFMPQSEFTQAFGSPQKPENMPEAEHFQNSNIQYVFGAQQQPPQINIQNNNITVINQVAGSPGQNYNFKKTQGLKKGQAKNKAKEEVNFMPMGGKGSVLGPKQGSKRPFYPQQLSVNGGMVFGNGNPMTVQDLQLLQQRQAQMSQIQRNPQAYTGLVIDPSILGGASQAQPQRHLRGLGGSKLQNQKAPAPTITNPANPQSIQGVQCGLFQKKQAATINQQRAHILYADKNQYYRPKQTQQQQLASQFVNLAEPGVFTNAGRQMVYKSSDSLNSQNAQNYYVTPAAQANGYHQLMLAQHQAGLSQSEKIKSTQSSKQNTLILPDNRTGIFQGAQMEFAEQKQELLSQKKVTTLSQDPYAIQRPDFNHITHQEMPESFEIDISQLSPTQIRGILGNNQIDLATREAILQKVQADQTMRKQQLYGQPIIGNQVAKKEKSKIPFSNAYIEDCYKFIIVSGNNSGLIRRAMERRDWWIEIPAVHSMFNFKWQPFSWGFKFDRLPQSATVHHAPNTNTFGGGNNVESRGMMGGKKDTTQIFNHLENHQLISEKQFMFENLQKLCENVTKENIFELTPVTFFIDVQDVEKTNQLNQSLQPFVNLYNALEEAREHIPAIKESIEKREKYLQDMAKIEEEKQQVSESEEKDESETSNSEDQPQTQNTQENEADLSPTQIYGGEKFLQMQSQKTQANTTMKGVTKFKTFNFDKQKNPNKLYQLPLCHFDSYNLWLLKATNLNRGRGIHVFRDLESLQKLIKEYCKGKDEEFRSPKKNKKAKEDDKKEETKDIDDDLIKEEDELKEEEIEDFDQDKSQKDLKTEPPLEGKEQQDDEAPSSPQTKTQKPSPSKKSANLGKIKQNSFIIQKYIEKPLLIFNRKFDIRVWVLVNHEHDVFFFKEGYLRTSGSEFSIDLNNVDNAFVHLTNNAVQKFSESYGQFEDGNNMSFDAFQHYIDEFYPEAKVDVRKDLVPQMKEMVIKNLYSVRRTIDPKKRRFTFELFGYDFILDESFNMWLIEVNTNPCIEDSSKILEAYLPRMVEDMLKLSVDLVFPKIRKKKQKGRGQTQSDLEVIQNTSQEQIHKEEPKSPKEKESKESSPARDEKNESFERDSNQDSPYNPKKEKKPLTKDQLAAKRIHPVPGYENHENMWEKIWNLSKSEQPQTLYPNKRSPYWLQLQEKNIKLKKYVPPPVPQPKKRPEKKPVPNQESQQIEKKE